MGLERPLGAVEPISRAMEWRLWRVASPAWAPSAAPTFCDSEVGMPRGSVVYFTRFHTPSTTAPLDVVGFVYFNSSSVSEVMFRF
jgi:hypothetical protein